MSLQAFIGQRSLNCYVGKYVWMLCSCRTCMGLVRVLRTLMLMSIVSVMLTAT
jgi:hypothetical protein